MIGIQVRAGPLFAVRVGTTEHPPARRSRRSRRLPASPRALQRLWQTSPIIGSGFMMKGLELLCGSAPITLRAPTGMSRQASSSAVLILSNSDRYERCAFSEPLVGTRLSRMIGIMHLLPRRVLRGLGRPSSTTVAINRPALPITTTWRQARNRPQHLGLKNRMIFSVELISMNQHRLRRRRVR
jgi:hypothetical protein